LASKLHNQQEARWLNYRAFVNGTRSTDKESENEMRCIATHAEKAAEVSIQNPKHLKGQKWSHAVPQQSLTKCKSCSGEQFL
jgi:hypothetical protein